MTNSLPSPKKTITQTFRFRLGGGSGGRTQGLHSSTSMEPGAELPISHTSLPSTCPTLPALVRRRPLSCLHFRQPHLCTVSTTASLLLCQSSSSALAEALQPIGTLGWCRAGGCADQGQTYGSMSCPALTHGSKQAMPLSVPAGSTLLCVSMTTAQPVSFHAGLWTGG